MGRHPRSWLGTIKNKFARSPRNRVIAVQCNSKDNHVQTETEAEKDNLTEEDSLERVLTEEDLAAIKIQAFFRGHLARQAFRALRSLVKLQALVRGVCVRRQARIALHCMHTLVRLQVKVRVMQLLSKSDQDI